MNNLDKQQEDMMSIRKVNEENIKNVLREITSMKRGLETGYKSLDWLIYGLQKGEVYLMAARPAMGKTWLWLNIIHNIMKKTNKPILYVNSEESYQQIVQKMLYLEVGVHPRQLQTDGDAELWNQFIGAAKQIGRGNVAIDDTPGLSIEELRSRLYEQEMLRECELIVIDSLQLISEENNMLGQETLVTACRELKELAVELKIPIVVLSQLTRKVEKRSNKRPVLSDLENLQLIEQYVETVMFLYRDDYYYANTSEKRVAEIIVARNKYGPLGSIELQWDLDKLVFCEHGCYK